MPYLKEIKKMQESLRFDGYTQIKIKDNGYKKSKE